MPSAAFSRSLSFVLRWEGGYVNHPDDRGGATNRGVTQAVYDTWRRSQGQSPQDVRLLADAEMQAIYEANYWRAARCDVLAEGLDLAHFDTAVNMGVGRAVRFLQATVGCTVDGGFGDGTLKAVQGCADVGKALVNYCDRRGRFYTDLVAAKPSQTVFLKGWNNRLNALRKAVGLPGFEADVPLDFGDATYIERIPDIDASDPSAL